MAEFTRDQADVIDSLVLSCSRLYMGVTQHALDRFGLEGGVAARAWLRNEMVYRGGIMAKNHDEMGLPRNAQNMWNYYDGASIEGVTIVEKANTPYHVCMDTPSCIIADVFKEANFHMWGHVLCDEVHQSAGMAYHPDLTVSIHHNLIKGDPACTFRWTMPPQPEGTPTEPDPRGGKTMIGKLPVTKETWRSPEALMMRQSRFLGMRVFFGVKEFTDRFGKDGEEVFRLGLRAAARYRAQAMRKYHASRGLPINVESFIKYMDVPFTHSWERRGESLSANRYSTEVTDCPLAQAWAELGDVSMGRMFCEEVYPALAAAYKPGSTVHVRQAMSRGDRACSFTIHMPQ